MSSNPLPFSSATYYRWKPLLDSFTPTPLGLSGLMLNIVRDLFTFNDTPFKYSSVPTESKLVIDLHQMWDAGNCENFPAIFIKRGNWKNSKVIIANRSQILMEEDGYSWTHTKVAEVDYEIRCLAREYGEIEELGSIAFQLLNGFSYPISTVFHFLDFDVQGESETQVLKEEKNYRLCVIPIKIQFEYSWKNSIEKV